jgi:hypothetical protein
MLCLFLGSAPGLLIQRVADPQRHCRQAEARAHLQQIALGIQAGGRVSDYSSFRQGAGLNFKVGGFLIDQRFVRESIPFGDAPVIGVVAGDIRLRLQGG